MTLVGYDPYRVGASSQEMYSCLRASQARVGFRIKLLAGYPGAPDMGVFKT